jgi:predicted HAD superfamily Cof-like phosphohydrolase
MIDQITEWHRRARPNPTHVNLGVQIGVHFEECGEMLEALAMNDARISNALAAVKSLAYALKSGEIRPLIADRNELLDSLADQIVTAAGVGHCAGMDVTEACARVNASNWSKFVDGQPVFTPTGKIDKGPDYVKPDLTGLY